MFYYLYKITNTKNNKIYVGVHKTKNVNDEYMGSGKVILSAIKKYGKENFIKEIIEFFDDENSMYNREKEIITDEFLLREDVYNLRRGGTGGFDYINSNTKLLSERNKKIASKRDNSAQTSSSNKTKKTKKYKKMMSDSLKKYISENGPMWQGKNHTDESKKKIGAKNSIKQSGNNNSQFGTIWITNGNENKKIKNTETIPTEWYKGRTLKK